MTFFVQYAHPYRSGVFKLPLKFSLVFLVLFFVQVLGDLNSSSWFSMYTGCISTSVFILMFVVFTRLKGRFHRRILFGLVTLFIGQVSAVFMAPGPGAFLYNLIFPGICYIFFTSAFYLDFRSAPELDKKGVRYAIFVAFLLSFTVYLYFRPYLGVYRIPVLIYTFIISLMAMMASFRRLRVNSQSFVLVLSGIGVLIVADVAFAIDKFVSQSEAANYLAGGGHLLALYLIVAGGITRILKPSDSPF